MLMHQIPGSLHEACREWEDTVDKFVVWLDENPEAEADADDDDDDDEDPGWNFGAFLAKHDLKNSSSRIKNIDEST